VLLPNTPLEPAVTVAERLVAAIAQTPLVLSDGRELPAITVSMGVAQAYAGRDLAELISRADAALYRAKERGRNRVVH
jgi:diguanylate cyclase (GGDEF)-like protein